MESTGELACVGQQRVGINILAHVYITENNGWACTLYQTFGSGIEHTGTCMPIESNLKVCIMYQIKVGEFDT